MCEAPPHSGKVCCEPMSGVNGSKAPMRCRRFAACCGAPSLLGILLPLLSACGGASDTKVVDCWLLESSQLAAAAQDGYCTDAFARYVEETAPETEYVMTGFAPGQGSRSSSDSAAGGVVGGASSGRGDGDGDGSNDGASGGGANGSGDSGGVGGAGAGDSFNIGIGGNPHGHRIENPRSR